MFEFIADLGMIFGPCVGYIIQTNDIIANQKAEGFSQHACFILLMANLVRIFWWYAVPFATTLLYASILMMLCQFCLLFFWVQVTNRNNTKGGFQESFWCWLDFKKYLQVIGAVAGILFACSQGFNDNAIYAGLLGTASAAIEAMLGVPQFKLNWERQHTVGLSKVLIGMWLAGDLYKMFFYNATDAPLQLKACAAFQVFTDLAIFVQFWIYRNNSPKAQD